MMLLLPAAVFSAFHLVALPAPSSIEARLLRSVDEEVECGLGCEVIRFPSQELAERLLLGPRPAFVPRLESALAALERRAIWEKR